MTQNQSQPQLLDPDVAYALVHQRIYQPVFFEKLAQDYGIAPQNDNEAVSMLTMAAQLRAAHDQNQKQAQDNTLALAQNHLNQQLTKLGFANPEAQTAQRAKEAAAQASFDPELAHAILSLQTAALMAEQQAA